MLRLFVAIAALFGGTAVAAGAFAAHALKPQLSERMLATFETAVRYQMYHALALLAVALLWGQGDGESSLLKLAGWGFIVGVAIFSGSLYGLSLSGFKLLGAITPVGGIFLILSWGCLALAMYRAQ